MDSYNNTDKNLTKPPTSSKKLPISIFVISLPLLYVSLLNVPLSSLFKDTAFLFLVSNSIIIVVAAESGVFASSSSSTSSNDALYDDYVRHVPKARSAYSNPIPQTSNMAGEEEEIPKHVVRESSNAREEGESSKEIRLDSEPEAEPAEQKQEPVSDEPEPELELEITEVAPERPKYERRWSELSLTKTEMSKDLLPRANTMTEKRSCAMEENDYVRMSDEELNERVEDFIRRFNREIRLQERMSSAVF
ncbi:uncharacterized protein A4U43_C07F34310 [Asparagus officinalis]|uniref:DUF4408 domain-containing protein n=1 Tax=Asparagus officinalis TaxID=4686 RepID=A0A5P1EM87_ASPOF|nr:uncharacterized protein LOC109849047 [Asparagus officinalis]ONK65160.1 uncharacterized protein A4U43_C07F34310 [Asparagus officinalis]